MHMNFFKKLFGAAKKPEAEATLSTPVDPVETPADAANMAARIASEECLDRHWQAVGTVERDVLTYMISPSFTGGPHWPSTRQAYRVVRRDGSIVLATE